MNHEKTIVPKEEIRSEIGTDAYFGGLSDESSGGLQPAKYVDGLARAVSHLGVIFCEHTQVEKINRNPDRTELITSRGDIKAEEVIIATNGYTDMLVPELKPRVFPVGSYIIVTEPLPKDLQDELSPKRRMFYDSKWFINYFRLTRMEGCSGAGAMTLVQIWI